MYTKWEQYIIEIARDRRMELKTYKKMALDGDQYRKRINSHHTEKQQEEVRRRIFTRARLLPRR